MVRARKRKRKETKRKGKGEKRGKEREGGEKRGIIITRIGCSVYIWCKCAIVVEYTNMQKS